MFIHAFQSKKVISSYFIAFFIEKKLVGQPNYRCTTVKNNFFSWIFLNHFERNPKTKLLYFGFALNPIEYKPAKFVIKESHQKTEIQL
jgi:hypothetical protein